MSVQIGAAAAYTGLHRLSRYQAEIPRASSRQACQPHVLDYERIPVIARREVYWSIDLNWDVVEIEHAELGVEKVETLPSRS